jgi:hypothetical protein
MASEKPVKREYFFKKGNTYSKGRPRVSLKTPDILLPAILNKSGINWAHDFTKLYKKMRKEGLNEQESALFQLLLKIMPYVIAKVDIKPEEIKKLLDQGSSVAAARATSALLKSLEMESNVKPTATGAGSSGGLAPGKPVLPPPPEPA